MRFSNQDGADLKLDCALKIGQSLQVSFGSFPIAPVSRTCIFRVPALRLSTRLLPLLGKHGPRQLVLQHIRSASHASLLHSRRGTGQPRRFASQRGVDCAEGRCQCLSFSVRTHHTHPFL